MFGALGQKIADDLVVAAGRRIDQRRPALLIDVGAALRATSSRSPDGRRAPPPSAPCRRIALRASTFARAAEQDVHRRGVAGRARRPTSAGSPFAVDGVRIRCRARAGACTSGDAIVGDGDHEVRRAASAACAAGAATPMPRRRARPANAMRQRRPISAHRCASAGRSRTGGRNCGRRPGDRPRAARPRRRAISAATCGTKAGWLRLPRCGTGARYGESVSISRRSSGTRRATSFRSCAFLNVTMPENEMWKPRSSAARATSQRSR